MALFRFLSLSHEGVSAGVTKMGTEQLRRELRAVTAMTLYGQKE